MLFDKLRKVSTLWGLTLSDLHASSEERDREILCDHVSSLEEDDKVHLKLDGERLGGGGGAGEEAGEDDVHGNDKVATHIAIRQLKVQDLGGCSAWGCA